MIKKILILGLSSILLAGSMINCNQKKADDKFVKIAEQTNAHLPMTISPGISLEKAEAVSNKEFKFYYKLNDKPNISAEEFEKNAKPRVIEALKAANSPDIKLFSENKMTLVYIYNTNEGKFAEIRLNPEEYVKK